MVEKVPMTVGGHKALSEELDRRTKSDRRRIVDAIAEARAHGDLSENAEYHAAKEEQSLNEGRIKQLESILGRAEVVDPSTITGDTIRFGATVTLIDEETEEQKIYQIVGDQEADPKEGRISISSPISRALIGKSPGDSIEVKAPKGDRAYEVEAVEYR